jgi:archaemetzincin
MEKSNGRCPVNRIQVLPLGNLPNAVLAELSGGLAEVLGSRCEILRAEPVPSRAFNVSRQQYSSTEILAGLAGRKLGDTSRLVAVTSSDLFVPVLTFVFGEAQLEGRCAVVSTCRLRQEFYGLPADPTLEGRRLLKEAVHELGHTFGLAHCENYECVMAPSHAVEWIDLKSSKFCQACRKYLSS